MMLTHPVSHYSGILIKVTVELEVSPYVGVELTDGSNQHPKGLD
jgi:hypothetical protein